MVRQLRVNGAKAVETNLKAFATRVLDASPDAVNEFDNTFGPMLPPPAVLDALHREAQSRFAGKPSPELTGVSL